jgi:hypothetical protein
VRQPFVQACLWVGFLGRARALAHAGGVSQEMCLIALPPTAPPWGRAASPRCGVGQEGCMQALRYGCPWRWF